jgi:hypothetical protein
MINENGKVANVIHKLRGLMQVLNNFVDCLEKDVKKVGLTNMQPNEVKEYCSIITCSLDEIRNLVKELENASH